MKSDMEVTETSQRSYVLIFQKKRKKKEKRKKTPLNFKPAQHTLNQSNSQNTYSKTASLCSYSGLSRYKVFSKILNCSKV